VTVKFFQALYYAVLFCVDLDATLVLDLFMPFSCPLRASVCDAILLTSCGAVSQSCNLASLYEIKYLPLLIPAEVALNKK
jgi:hypothetical protein